MGTGYSIDWKLLNVWSFGPLELVSCEINPRTGPVDVCHGTEKTGERWLSRVHAVITDWQPSPHEETCFALFLVDRKWMTLFEAVCDTPEKLALKTGQVLKVLETLAGRPVASTDEECSNTQDTCRGETPGEVCGRQATKTWRPLMSGKNTNKQYEETATKSEQSYKQSYQLPGRRCSWCESTGPFLLDPSEDFSIDQDGEIRFPSGEWGLDIDCDCAACGFAGRLGDFCEWVAVTERSVFPHTRVITVKRS
jgi:hypothetical protein